MIARVRIAPVEQWCEGAKRNAVPAVKKRAGQFVSIDTKSMWMQTENGERFRNWRLVGDDLTWIQLNADGATSLCEHMLEMD
jgi:hypothetical protein